MTFRIIQGDCLEVMRTMPDKSVDLVLCDLPYGTTACKWDTIIPFEPLWEQYKRIIKPNRAIVLTASQPFTSKLVMSNIKMFKYCWVWDKTRGYGHLVCRVRPMQQTEDIAVFGDGKISYYPQTKKRDKPIFCDERTGKRTEIMGGKISQSYKGNWVDTIQPTNLVRFPQEAQTCRTHPTQKPVSLMEYLISTYTQEGDTVLDNCMGSGTTGVAALKLGRIFIGIEIDPKYCAMAEKRIKNECGLLIGANQ
jgi:site-specific DNA-methyltransferase (adenine-specific)